MPQNPPNRAPGTVVTMAAAGSSDPVTEYLQSLGGTAEQIEAARATGNLHALAGDLVMDAGVNLSAGDLAASLGASVDSVLELARALGIEVAHPDEPRFCAEDEPLFRVLLDQGMLPLEDGDLLRVVGSSVARIAEAAVSAFVQDVEAHLRDVGIPALDRVRATAETAELAMVVGEGLRTLLLHHLRQAVRRQRASQITTTDREVVRVAVGFVDLVGFTPLSRQLSPRELVDLVRRFERRAFDVASNHGGRVVKHIGDEIMFVALEPAAACRLALDLVDQLGEGGLPRGGLSCGDVLTRHGDYYGPVVNLASRLGDEAVPGEVLVDEAVVRAADHADDIVFEPAGRRLPKGFDEPVRVWTLARL
jgi:adenylate cyclase